MDNSKGIEKNEQPIKEEKEELIAERRKKRKAKSKYSNMENDDLEKMLKWKNGVGHLPGNLL